MSRTAFVTGTTSVPDMPASIEGGRRFIPVSYSGQMEAYLTPEARRWYVLPYLETSPECIRQDVIDAVRVHRG